MDIFGFPGPNKKSKRILRPIAVPVFSNKISAKNKRDSFRSFSQSVKNEVWDRQHGKCARCKNPLKRQSTDYDHIKPYAKGGRSTAANCRAVCKNCHGVISHKTRLKTRRKKKSTNPYLGTF